MPERLFNLCCGGIDNTTLFITARTSFHSITVQVKGQAVEPPAEVEN